MDEPSAVTLATVAAGRVAAADRANILFVQTPTDFTIDRRQHIAPAAAMFRHRHRRLAAYFASEGTP